MLSSGRQDHCKVAAPAKVENLPPEWEGKDVLAQPVQAINNNCLMPYVLTKGKANVSVHLVNLFI